MRLILVLSRDRLYSLSGPTRYVFFMYMYLYNSVIRIPYKRGTSFADTNVLRTVSLGYCRATTCRPTWRWSTSLKLLSAIYLLFTLYLYENVICHECVCEREWMHACSSTCLLHTMQHLDGVPTTLHNNTDCKQCNYCLQTPTCRYSLEHSSCWYLIVS